LNGKSSKNVEEYVDVETKSQNENNNNISVSEENDTPNNSTESNLDVDPPPQRKKEEDKLQISNKKMKLIIDALSTLENKNTEIENIIISCKGKINEFQQTITSCQQQQYSLIECLGQLKDLLNLGTNSM